MTTRKDNMIQKQKPTGDSPTDNSSGSSSGLKRLAPDSNGLLKEAENATKAAQKESFEQRKRRILSQCGC